MQEPEIAKLWQSKFGFKPLNKKQLAQLQASVPPLNYYEDSILLTKQLPKQRAVPSLTGHKPAAPVLGQPPAMASAAAGSHTKAAEQASNAA